MSVRVSASLYEKHLIIFAKNVIENIHGEVIVFLINTGKKKKIHMH